MLIEKYICKKCGNFQIIEHLGEMNGDELHDFLMHLQRCKLIEIWEKDE